MRKLLVAAGIAVLFSMPVYAQVSQDGGMRQRSDIPPGAFVVRPLGIGANALAGPVIEPVDRHLMPPSHPEVSIFDQGT